MYNNFRVGIFPYLTNLQYFLFRRKQFGENCITRADITRARVPKGTPINGALYQLFYTTILRHNITKEWTMLKAYNLYDM